MTEEEMKTKWCPFARAVPNAQGYASGNRFDNDPGSELNKLCLCIGSQCAAWVKEPKKASQTERQADGFPKFVDSGEGSCGLIKETRK